MHACYVHTYLKLLCTYVSETSQKYTKWFYTKCKNKFSFFHTLYETALCRFGNKIACYRMWERAVSFVIHINAIGELYSVSLQISDASR